MEEDEYGYFEVLLSKRCPTCSGLGEILHPLRDHHMRSSRASFVDYMAEWAGMAREEAEKIPEKVTCDTCDGEGRVDLRYVDVGEIRGKGPTEAFRDSLKNLCAKVSSVGNMVVSIDQLGQANKRLADADDELSTAIRALRVQVNDLARTVTGQLNDLSVPAAKVSGRNKPKTKKAKRTTRRSRA